MIQTRAELKEWISYEKQLYTAEKKIDRLVAFFCRDYCRHIWKFVKFLRLSEYHLNNSSVKTSVHTMRAFYHDLAFLLCRYRRNRQGLKCNIEILENSFDKGLCIYHCAGGILVNGYARIGRDCFLHGNNCIGNKGYDNGVPMIGNNVDIGFGASIIGNVTIGDNTVIAAGAVVVNSFPEGNVVIGGCPAKVIKRKPAQVS